MTLVSDRRGVVVYEGEQGVLASEMYTTYQAWCVSLDKPVFDQTRLEATLRSKFPDFSVRELKVNGKVQRVFFGIPMRPSVPEVARA